MTRFETAVRGYNRHDVDEFAARTRRYIASLQDRLAAAVAEAGRLRAELTEAQHAAPDRPAQQELSARMNQILQLAGQEAQGYRDRAAKEITRLRWEAQEDVERRVKQARGEAKQMLAEAQQAAERAITSARAEAWAGAEPCCWACSRSPRPTTNAPASHTSEISPASAASSSP